jgi:gas vesicle protein
MPLEAGPIFGATIGALLGSSAAGIFASRVAHRRRQLDLALSILSKKIEAHREVLESLYEVKEVATITGAEDQERLNAFLSCIRKNSLFLSKDLKKKLYNARAKAMHNAGPSTPAAIELGKNLAFLDDVEEAIIESSRIYQFDKMIQKVLQSTE